MARALRRHLFVMAPPGYRKRRSDAEQRRDWFCAFNVEATKRNAFIISTPGSPDVIVEVLPGSDWISELKERGFPIRWLEDGQRILLHAIVENITVEGSTATKPVTHHGIVATQRFRFPAPY